MMRGTDFDNLPLPGVRCFKELNASVAAASGGFSSYHTEWEQRSGVSN